MLKNSAMPSTTSTWSFFARTRIMPFTLVFSPVPLLATTRSFVCVTVSRMVTTKTIEIAMAKRE